MKTSQDFWSKVAGTSGDDCLIWQASKSYRGYGQVWWNGSRQIAHRIAYQLVIGEIPEGLTLDHLCRQRDCVNPWHLEPVTNQVNIKRGIGIPVINAAKTHCHRGHEFTPENTRLQNTSRVCRACERERYYLKTNPTKRGRYKKRSAE